MLLSDALHIRSWNRAARHVVAHGDPLYVAAGQLAGTAPRFDAALRQAMHRLASATGPAIVRMPVAGHLLPFSLCLLGLQVPAEETAAGATALAFIHHPANRLAVQPWVLRAAFDLTPAEAKAASALAAGHDPAGIARMQNVAISTVRKHVAAAYRKLGVHRAQDLAALLNTSPFAAFIHAADTLPDPHSTATAGTAA